MEPGDRAACTSSPTASGPITLYAYDTATRKVARLVENGGLDIKSASAGPDAIVYEQFGGLYLYDLKGGKRASAWPCASRPTSAACGRSTRRSAARVSNYALSPTGARAVFEARGEILTVPAEKGDVRNLTNTSGVADRDPGLVAGRHAGSRTSRTSRASTRCTCASRPGAAR